MNISRENLCWREKSTYPWKPAIATSQFPIKVLKVEPHCKIAEKLWVEALIKECNAYYQRILLTTQTVRLHYVDNNEQYSEVRLCFKGLLRTHWGSRFMILEDKDSEYAYLNGLLCSWDKTKKEWVSGRFLHLPTFTRSISPDLLTNNSQLCSIIDSLSQWQKLSKVYALRKKL